MWRPTPRKDRGDAAGPQAVTVGLRVVAPVALEGVRFAPRTTATAAHRRERVDHRVEMRNVVDVGGRYLGDERDAARIGNEVVFGALLAAIGWVRSSFFPPRSARTDALSITVER